MYIRQRSLISAGASAAAFPAAPAPFRICPAAAVARRPGNAVRRHRYSSGRGLSGLPAAGAVFLRLGAADRASCVMEFSGELNCLGHVYTQNPAIRQWVVAGKLIPRHSVDRRIQCGIVIHFHLPVEFEATRPATVSRHSASRQPARSARCSFRTSSRSRLRSAWPSGASLRSVSSSRVVDLQRQNRKPVDDHSRRLRVQAASHWWGKPRGCKPLQHRAVQLFNQIIAQLVGPVHPPLYLGNLGVARRGVRASSSTCHKSKFARCCRATRSSHSPSAPSPAEEDPPDCACGFSCHSRVSRS